MNRALRTAAVLATTFAVTSAATYVYEGEWGRLGVGHGAFMEVAGVAVAANGTVYVSDASNNRIQYLTPTGSFLGTWGEAGNGPGEFNRPAGVAAANFGKRVYVADVWNHRVQYFRRVEHGLEPCSLGRAKALFK